MPRTFVSAPLVPVESAFDAAAMARGEPGLPGAFYWGERELVIAEVLERTKAYGDCAHGSGERYVRRHVFWVKTTEGAVLELFFQRSFGRGCFERKTRWWLRWIEEVR